MKKLRFWQKTYMFTLMLFLLALFGGIVFIGWKNQQQMLGREMDKTKSEQHFIAQSLTKDLAAIQGNLHLRAAALARSYGQYYTQSGILLEITHKGELLFSNLPSFSNEAAPLTAQSWMQHWATRAAGGVAYSVVCSNLADGFEEYTLTCARSLEPLTKTWRQMHRTLVLGSGGVCVLLAIGLFFILRGIVRPLEKLACVADEFAAGNFSARAVKKGADELADLAQSFNAMADTAQLNIAQISETADQNARMAANLSHEIRTPLTAIQGYAEYMQIANLTDNEQASALAYIVDESRRLQKISQRMLQLSSLQHDEIKLIPLNLAEISRRAYLSARAKADHENITLRVGQLPDVFISGDDILLESLLLNLLDNAIKACSKNGSVCLGLAHGQGKATVTIGDNGCGLSQDQLGKLGEPFYRPDNSRSRKQGGAGLGVALCYQIAQLHAAALWYESAPQQGTMVFIEFTAL